MSPTPPPPDATLPEVWDGLVDDAAIFPPGDADLADALANEAELMALTGGSSDHRAAVDAFLAKEKPTYTGA